MADEAIIRIRFEDAGTGPTSPEGNPKPDTTPPPEPTQSASEEQQEAERESAIRLLVESLDRLQLRAPASPPAPKPPLTLEADRTAQKQRAEVKAAMQEIEPPEARPPEARPPEVQRVKQPPVAKPYDYRKQQRDEDKIRSSLDKVADLFENFGGRLGGSLGRLAGSIGNLLAKISQQRVKPPVPLAPLATLVPSARPSSTAIEAAPVPPAAPAAPVIPTAQVAPPGATLTPDAVAKPARPSGSIPFALPAPPGATLTPGAVATRVPAPVTKQAGGPVPEPASGLAPHPAARGTDTVPAMLTPGEVVVPREAAAKNRPALDEMISGKTQYRSHGGAIQYMASGGVAAAASLVGGPASVAVAVFEVISAFKDTLTGATRQLGEFATALADPDANPAPFVQNFGKGISAAGDAIFYISPAASILVGVLGEVTGAFGKLMGALDGTAKRYGQYSPQIAVAQASSEITQIMGDIRRSREAAPDLAMYLQAQTQMQQKIEDVKVRFIMKIMPAVLATAGLIEKLLPVVELGFDAVLAILENIPLFGAEVKKIREEIERYREMSEGIKDMDPTTAALMGYLAPGSEVGRTGTRGRPGDPRGVWTPDL